MMTQRPPHEARPSKCHQWRWTSHAHPRPQAHTYTHLLSSARGSSGRLGAEYINLSQRTHHQCAWLAARVLPSPIAAAAAPATGRMRHRLKASSSIEPPRLPTRVPPSSRSGGIDSHAKGRSRRPSMGTLGTVSPISGNLVAKSGKCCGLGVAVTSGAAHPTASASAASSSSVGCRCCVMWEHTHRQRKQAATVAIRAHYDELDVI